MLSLHVAGPSHVSPSLKVTEVHAAESGVIDEQKSSNERARVTVPVLVNPGSVHAPLEVGLETLTKVSYDN